jgi:hypothetical protein
MIFLYEKLLAFEFEMENKTCYIPEAFKYRI